MIPFKNRFHGHSSLNYVYRKGQVVRSHFATLKSIANPKRSTPRIAVVVGKKIIKSAVKRNRIRRRIYEHFRSVLEQLLPNSDIVVIVTSGEVYGISAVDLSSAIEQLITDSRLYKTPQS